MNNHITLKDFLLANIGTLENPIPPKDLQIIIAGGENDSIKYFDLRHMRLERLRTMIATAPDVKLMGGDRSHPSIQASLLLTTASQSAFSATIDFLGKFCIGYHHIDMTNVSAALARMSRNGDFAYQQNLTMAFESFYRNLSVAEREALDRNFDRRAIPLVDCGIYDASAVRATSTDVELYIPLNNEARVAVWLVIILDQSGYVSYNFTMRLTARSEAVIIGKAQLGDLPFYKALQLVSQEYK
jgi:hypothetical protein